MSKIQWMRKQGRNEIEEKTDGIVTYLSFPLLEQAKGVSHSFSTRLGGASRGYFGTMNFSFTRGDDPKAVMENYSRMAGVLGTDVNRMVLSHQTHTTHVRRVTEEDCGKGIIKERDYTDVDGLVTDIPGITLVTFYADCVPLYFYDPVHRAIGLSHSGWRGTANHMGRITVERMTREFGSRPEEILSCIGPSICQDCYEVGEEVAEAFRKSFGQEFWPEILTPGAGTYQLNLWRANERILLNSGIRKEHLSVTNICTQCNPNLLYSHRVMGNERGNLAAFLSLKEDLDA